VSLDFSVTYFLPIVPWPSGSTQPLVKMSTRNIPGGKGGRCVRLTDSPHSRAECREVWEPKPPGTGPVTGHLYLYLFYHAPPASASKDYAFGVSYGPSISRDYFLEED